MVFCARTLIAILHLQLVSLAVALCGHGSFSRSDGWHCVEITSSHTMYYMVDAQSRVRIGIHARNHSGWTGIGVNGNGGMKGASMIVVRKVDDRWVAEDRHSDSYTQPVMDEQQDVSLVSAQELNGDITFSIMLPRNSCDENDYPIKDMTQTVLWARGPSHDFTYHGRRADIDRGALEVNFFRAPATPVDPPNAITIDVRMPNVPIKGGPNGQHPSNAYICAAFDLQALGIGNVKMHVTKYEPIISDGNHPYVHHMIMNPCYSGKPSYAEGSDTSTWWRLDCEAMVECAGANFAWAVGSGPVVFPPEAGFPLPVGVRYAAIQMHYYNPELHTGLYDSSGFRLTLTTSLRQYDVGTVQLNGGTNAYMATALPPGLQEVSKYLQVPSQCFDAVLPAGMDEVQVLKSFHHEHQLGKKMDIRLIRDGVDMGPLRNEKVFDFQHQSFADSEFDTLKRTDSLLVHCRYDTSKQTEPVSFGDLTQQEMCFGGMYYYPAVGSIDAWVILPTPAVATHPDKCMAFDGCLDLDVQLPKSERRKDYVCKLGTPEGASACEHMLRYDPMGFLWWRNARIGGQGPLLEFCMESPNDAQGCEDHECTTTFNFCHNFTSTCEDGDAGKCTEADVVDWAQSFCADYCGDGNLYPNSSAPATRIVSYHMQDYCLQEGTDSGISMAEEMLLVNPLKLWMILEGEQSANSLRYFSGSRWPSLEEVCNEHKFNIPPFQEVPLSLITNDLQICPYDCAAAKNCSTEELKHHAKIATGRLCTGLSLSGFPSMYPNLKMPASGSASPAQPTCNEVRLTLAWQEKAFQRSGMKTSECEIGNAHLCSTGMEGCLSSYRDNVLCPRFGICNGSYPMTEVCQPGWTDGTLTFDKLVQLRACMPQWESRGSEAWLKQQCEDACNDVAEDGKHITGCAGGLKVVSQTFEPSPGPACVPEGSLTPGSGPGTGPVVAMASQASWPRTSWHLRLSVMLMLAALCSASQQQP